MKLPLPWRRKSTASVLSSSPPAGLSLISGPTSTASSSSSTSTSSSQPTSPRSPRTPAFLTAQIVLRTTPRPHRFVEQHNSPPSQLYRSNEDTDTETYGTPRALYQSTVTDTVTDTYSDLYASEANVGVDVEDGDLYVDDDFLDAGMLPCSPRWVADHADASVRQHRAAAQMGALIAMRGRHLALDA